MGQRNLAYRAYTRSQLTELPVGAVVLDGEMEIFVKCSARTWRGERGQTIETDTLHRPPHTPVRPWKGSVPR